VDGLREQVVDRAEKDDGRHHFVGVVRRGHPCVTDLVECADNVKGLELGLGNGVQHTVGFPCATHSSERGESDRSIASGRA